jgi:hypothetical protein
MRSAVALAEGPTAVVPMTPGRIVGGRYELVHQLGVGSMGEVWVAHHRTLRERVAVKVLSRGSEFNSLEDAATAAARFRFEAQVAARLSRGSKHIVRVTDHGEEGALAYLVMELLAGQTLETTLLRRGPVPTARLAEILGQVARALEHAHAEGVVHRDLKPANIFLAADEDGAPLVKILDFGIARSVRVVPEASAFSTAANVILGTPGYMSPEHARGATAPDLHCDLWALATITYEALTNELPVPGVQPAELLSNLHARRFVGINERVPSLPRSLTGFFERAFAVRPEDRYQRASELVREFERAVGEDIRSARTVAAARQTTWNASPGGHSQRTMPRSAVVLAGTCAIGAVMAVAAALPRRQSPQSPTAVPASPVRPPRIEMPYLPLAPTPVDESEREDSNAASAAASGPRHEVVAPEGSAVLRARPNCAVPYEYDREGIKRWKRACL